MKQHPLTKLQNVLFICIDGLTDPLGQSQILPYYAGLSQKGYRITILSAEKEDKLQEGFGVIKEKTKAAGIEWIYIKYKQNPPFISTLINYANLKKKAMLANKKISFDIVHCRSIISAILGHRLQKKFGLKFIFDMRGFWADERVDGKLWDLRNPLYKLAYRFFKKWEKRLFAEADYIISLTENAKRYILAHFRSKGKIQVIPCAADLKHFDYNNINSEKLEELRQELKLKNEDYVLSYIGSLGTRYRLVDMLRFFKLFKSNVPNAKFLIVTKSDTEQINHLCEMHGIDKKDIVISSSSYQEIPNYIALSKLSIFFIITSFSGMAVSPTKQAEVMGMGIPIIANTGLGDTDNIIRESNAGILLEEFTDEAFENCIKQLNQSNFNADHIRNEAIKRFSLQIAIEKYQEVYQNL